MPTVKWPWLKFLPALYGFAVVAARPCSCRLCRSAPRGALNLTVVNRLGSERVPGVVGMTEDRLDHYVYPYEAAVYHAYPAEHP